MVRPFKSRGQKIKSILSAVVIASLLIISGRKFIFFPSVSLLTL